MRQCHSLLEGLAKDPQASVTLVGEGRYPPDTTRVRSRRQDSHGHAIMSGGPEGRRNKEGATVPRPPSLWWTLPLSGSELSPPPTPTQQFPNLQGSCHSQPFSRSSRVVGGKPTGVGRVAEPGPEFQPENDPELDSRIQRPV